MEDGGAIVQYAKEGMEVMRCSLNLAWFELVVLGRMLDVTRD